MTKIRKYLFEYSDKSIFDDPEYSKPKEFKERITVKAIIKKGDKFGFVGSVGDLIGLVGGGSESKDLEKEVKRECLEETSWKVKVGKELFVDKGLVYRDAVKVVTHTFLVEADKKIDGDFREEYEKEFEYKMVFLSEDDALEKLRQQLEDLKNNKLELKDSYQASFIWRRDLKIFEEYLKLENKE